VFAVKDELAQIGSDNDLLSRRRLLFVSLLRSGHTREQRLAIFVVQLRDASH
jgi:hypothetical protein